MDISNNFVNATKITEKGTLASHIAAHVAILKAPKLHRCEFLLTLNRETKTKAKFENGIYAAAGNEQQASISSESGVFTLPPIDISSSSNSVVNQQPPRVIDVIFLDDNDEIRPDFQKDTPPAKNITSEKLESGFRSVGPDLYERAYNTRGNKYRLIVFEDEEKIQVRQYSQNTCTNNCWYCLGCFKKVKKNIRARFKDEIFFVPKKHFCDPFSYEEVKNEQKEIIQKFKINKANENAVNDEQQHLSVEPLQNFIRKRLRSRTPTAPVYCEPPLPPNTDERLIHADRYSNVPSRSPSFSSPILQRQQTPTDPFVRSRTNETPIFQTIPYERKARSSVRINAAPTPPKKSRSKSIERDNHFDPSNERLSFAPLQRTKSTENLCFNRKSYSWIKNGTQALGNTSSTTSSSNISTPVNLPSSSKPRILYSAKIPAPSSFASTPSSPFSTSLSQSSPLFSMANLASNVLTNKTPTRTFKDLILSPTPSSTSSTTTLPNSSDLTTTIKCYKPSTFFLKKSCEKLEINFCNESYNMFWFDFQKVSPNSIPENIHETSEKIYHGYECISLYFTGNEKNAAFIREKINQHFYYQNSQNPISRKKEGETLFSKSIKELHFQTISKWFDCRIGIFVENNWKRFGNWIETDSDIPTMLLKMEQNGKYSIIKSLK